jgi:nucleoside-diphosphate-sugar epimerase
MKVLVTGGAGYTGSLLVPLLLEAGHEVSVVDSLLFNQISLLPYFANDKFSFTKGDIRDKDAIKPLVDDADMIIHLVAIVGEPACRANPGLAREVNADASKTLNDLRGKKPLIYASTGSNYGKVEGICTEETPANPLSLYAETKLEAERVFQKSGNAILYRFATGFGLSPRLRLDLLVNDFCYQAVNGGNLIIYQKNVRRTFIHVRDMARALLYAVENFDAMKDNIYNVGHESLNHTKKDLIEKIQEYYPKLYVHYAEIGHDPDQRDYEVSYEKMRGAGFETVVTLSAGIKEMLKAFPSIKLHNPYANFQG